MRTLGVLLCGLLALPCGADNLRWGYGPADAMPYVGMTQGKVDRGLVHRLGLELALRLDLPIEFVETPNNRLEAYLQQGRLHLICNSNPDWLGEPQRYHWSPPLYEEEDALLQHRDRPPLTDLQSLHGKVLGTSLGYVYSAPLMAAFAARQILRQDVRDLDTSLQMLDKQRLDAVIDMRRNLVYKLAQYPQLRLRFSPWVVERYRVHCVYGPHLPVAAEQLDAILLQLRDDGSIAAWLDEALSSAPGITDQEVASARYPPGAPASAPPARP
ncbi:substrate-binding periplasmic protein [Pseudomonas sp. SP16.1]|uniref:substrate-binding periplasmic protein n=1 Tax=Pseudomonas sp. SP16.1 TaxID=3458854 RepID=UPI0040467F3A